MRTFTLFVWVSLLRWTILLWFLAVAASQAMTIHKTRSQSLFNTNRITVRVTHSNKSWINKLLFVRTRYYEKKNKTKQTTFLLMLTTHPNTVHPLTLPTHNSSLYPFKHTVICFQSLQIYDQTLTQTVNSVLNKTKLLRVLPSAGDMKQGVADLVSENTSGVLSFYGGAVTPRKCLHPGTVFLLHQSLVHHEQSQLISTTTSRQLQPTNSIILHLHFVFVLLVFCFALFWLFWSYFVCTNFSIKQLTFCIDTLSNTFNCW